MLFKSAEAPGGSGADGGAHNHRSQRHQSHGRHCGGRRRDGDRAAGIASVEQPVNSYTQPDLWVLDLVKDAIRDMQALIKIEIALAKGKKLYDKREDYSASLSGGQRKLLEMARALMTEPEFVLLDEPMAGMNLEEKEDMSRFILEVNQQYGTTIALIEHDMGVVMDISDRVVVLDYGKKIADGTPDEVKKNQAVIDAYLGVAH